MAERSGNHFGSHGGQDGSGMMAARQEAMLAGGLVRGVTPIRGRVPADVGRIDKGRGGKSLQITVDSGLATVDERPAEKIGENGNEGQGPRKRSKAA